jgi:two-component system phosphate regulon sensor histidine kinase PhoR
MNNPFDTSTTSNMSDVDAHPHSNEPDISTSSTSTSSNFRIAARSLLEAVPLPLFVIDRHCIIQHFNQHSQSLYEHEHLKAGLTLDKVLNSSAMLQLVKTSIQSNSQLHGQFEVGTPDIAYKVTVTPLLHLDDQSQETTEGPSAYTYFVVAIEDMTEARHIQHVQRDFIANISHELRTPLTSVRLLAETLEDAIDTDPDRAQEFVEKIETEVQYLSELVSELLELSRIESGQTPMVMEPTEAEHLVREVMARMLPLAQRHRVQLGTDIHQGETLVAADRKQITRVLVNLVHNAIKFTPSGGQIIIGTCLQPDQQTQRFYVSDTGIGIRTEELSRIFERFYKTDRARAKADFIGPGGGGTGLGLAIARHVVESHGGRISAQSTPGQGSTFTFTLPVALRNEQPGREDDESTEAKKSKF